MSVTSITPGSFNGSWLHTDDKGREFSDIRQTLTAEERTAETAWIDSLEAMPDMDDEPDFDGEEAYDRQEAFYASMAA